ncbi:MAG TPA: D-glycerate dehydrogenase [Desulfomonilaceae bacterium]|nr:D-glycerate dehydrogenase [Desulfomonilaceae bacterium]
MTPTIFVTRRLPEGAMQVLEDTFEVLCNPHDRVLTREELLAGVKGKDGILPLLTDRIDEEVLDAAGSQLKIVANYAVGYNNIDLSACSKRRIPATNTPGVLTDTTADLAMALLLAVARKVVPADSYARSGKYQGWAPLLFLGTDVHHKTLGLMGLGRIGFAVAKRAAGFDMNILYHDSMRQDPGLEEEVGAKFVSKSALLSQSDFVSLHVPLTPETHHLISGPELALMKSSAYLINTSRGEVLDEKALVKALQLGQVAGAGLDVFEFEPAIEKELTSMDNVVIVPHIASASIETRTKMGLLAAENLISVLIEGRRPPNCLNPEIFT